MEAVTQAAQNPALAERKANRKNWFTEIQTVLWIIITAHLRIILQIIALRAVRDQLPVHPEDLAMGLLKHLWIFQKI